MTKVAGLDEGASMFYFNEAGNARVATAGMFMAAVVSQFRLVRGSTECECGQIQQTD
jgi:hypothetical protein